MKTFKQFLEEKFKNYRDSWYGIDTKGKGYGHKNLSVYDDEHVEVKPDKMDDEKGKTIAWRQKITPKKDTVTRAEDIIPKDDDVIHRGMSHAEYSSIIKKGKIKSRGSGNIGKEQEGLTYFTKDPASADAYSNAFAQSRQKPTPKKPAYIVSIRRPDPSRIKHVEGTAEHEVGVQGDVSAEDIVAVHRGQVVAHTPATKSRGGSTSASSMLHWKRIK